MPPLRVSGEIATIRINIASFVAPDSPSKTYDSDADRLLFNTMQNQLGDMHPAIRQSVMRDLGPDVDVDPLALRYGSVELLVIITTAFTVIKNFNEYVEALEKVAENVRRIVVRAVGGLVSPAATTATRATVEMSEKMRLPDPNPPAIQSDDLPRPEPLRAGRLPWTNDSTQLMLLVNFFVVVALFVLVAVKL